MDQHIKNEEPGGEGTICRYRNLTPAEIVEYLCEASANGYREEAVAEKEQKLGVFFPVSLRTYLLRAGRERISGRRKEVFSLSGFQREGDYLILGETKQGMIGITCDAVSKADTEVFIRVASGDWQLEQESVTAWLLWELDQRIREAAGNQYMYADDEEDSEYRFLKSYFYCPYLLIKELAEYLKPPVPKETQGEWRDSTEEYIRGGSVSVGPMKYEYCRGRIILPDGLKEALCAQGSPVPGKTYSLGFGFDCETDTLYCAHLAQDGSIESLLQVNSQATVEICNEVSLERRRIIEALFTTLAREVHDPVLAYCMQKLDTLPEKIIPLANEELHNYVMIGIDDFLAIFEKKVPWKLGVLVAGNFVGCSRLSSRAPLHDLWYGHHLREDAEPWKPVLSWPETEGEPAPRQLEPLVEELIYRVHDYTLLNRHTFLARKIVADRRYLNLTADYTNEERFAFLSFYREMLDGVVERLFDCLERGLFTIQIKGQDFLSICSRPTAYLDNWLRWYRKKELDFLDTGCWQR